MPIPEKYFMQVTKNLWYTFANTYELSTRDIGAFLVISFLSSWRPPPSSR